MAAALHMDEYQLEIEATRSTLDRLRADEADPELIEEYEAQLRILVELYRAATELHDEGAGDSRLGALLADLEFGDWTLENVYAFVYDAALDMDLTGHDLAAGVAQTDFAGALRAAGG